MKWMLLLAAFLMLAATCSAQTVLSIDGRVVYTSSSAVPTATATASQDMQAITAVVGLQSPTQVGNWYASWTVDNSVVTVDVTVDGVEQVNPRWTDPFRPMPKFPTATYVAGGIQQICNACGLFNFNSTIGSHAIIFTAKNAAGQVIRTLPITVVTQ